MPDAPTGRTHLYLSYLRLYVALTPDHGESAWRAAILFDRLPDAQKLAGHWYRFGPGEGVIETLADGSAEWHKDGQLPAGLDPKLVIDVPAVTDTPTLAGQIIAVLSTVPADSPNHAQTMEMIDVVKDLQTSKRAARLATNFQKTLATVPAVAAEQIQFLKQASQQMVGQELLAGKVCGYDVAGILLIAALAEQVALTAPDTCVAVLTKAAVTEVGSTAELAAKVIEDCWWRKLAANITAALNSLRSEGDKIFIQARVGAYPQGHPELVLDIYYGGVLQAIPYLLAAEEAYHKLTCAPNVSEDDKALFAKRADTAEEKLVRLNNALLYAVKDVNLQRLRALQDQVASLSKTDPKKAESLVYEAIELSFFYPPNFRSVLTGESPTSNTAK